MIIWKWDSKLEYRLGGFEYNHADDVVANAGSGGATFRTDQLGTGQHVPFTKLMSGTADDTAIIPGDATNGLFVQVKASSTVAITDGSGSITTDSAQLPATLGQSTMANSMTVALASNQSSIPVAATLTAETTKVIGTINIAAAQTIAATQSGTWTVQPGNTANTTAWKVDGSAFTQPVSAASLPLPSGAATAAKQPALGTAGVSSTDVLSVQGIASGTAMPVSLASVPSHAVTNAGTFATQVDGAALTALQLIDNIVAVEDAAAAGGESGVPILAVRRDAASSGVSADGDFANLSVDSTGALRVTGGGGGTQYLEDAAHASGDTGTLSLAVRRDANTTFVSADGDYSPLAVDANGNLKVNIIAGAGSGGTAMADDAAFTVSTTSITPVGGTYRSTLDAVDDGDAGAFAMTANRALHVNLRDASGNELTSGAQYAEDAVHASGDFVTMAGVVRKDTATQLAGTDGDNSVLINDASGRLHVVQSTSTVGGASSIPAGTNNIGDVDVLTVPTDPFGANADAASATGSISAKLRFIAATGIPVTGTVTVGSHAVTNAGTFAVQNTAQASTNTQEMVGDAAHDAAISGNPVRVGGRALTADFTAVATGDTVDFASTILGKQIVMLNSIPDNTWVYAAAAGGLVTTTGVTAKAAAGAGIRNYVKSAQIINSHQTIGSEVVIRDGAAGTVLWRGWAQFTGGGAAFEFNPPLRGTANTLIEIAEVTTTATAGVLVNLQGYTAAE